MKSKKQYTISTLIFNSLKEAEDQLNVWFEDDTLKSASKIFEINEVRDIKITSYKHKDE